MLLAMQKKLHLYRDSQNKHIWDEHGTVTSIADSTVLIFGMGDIGRHFAKMAHALGAYVIGVKKNPGNCPEYIDEPHLMKDCRELLPHADVVVSFFAKYIRDKRSVQQRDVSSHETGCVRF